PGPDQCRRDAERREEAAKREQRAHDERPDRVVVRRDRTAGGEQPGERRPAPRERHRRAPRAERERGEEDRHRRDLGRERHLAVLASLLAPAWSGSLWPVAGPR